jgi:hypothetical protein
VGDYTWIELPNGERTFTLSPEDYDGTILAEGIDVQTDPLTELVDGEWVCPISVLKERKWEAVKAIRASCRERVLDGISQRHTAGLDRSGM